MPMINPKVYAICFTGCYPIGAYAVAVARSKEIAHQLLLEQLDKEAPDLVEDNTTFHAERYEEVCTASLGATPHCHIQSIGEY
ncbi:MAG: hypothetical protein CMM47_00560 [Rhodospirillaceae bacterium]|nr:hypothetical protein [Rhodospirillaceae bacterium]MBM84500.1 hypothetical protein [Rhodospirillaceae bacterium]|tara:strand:- start:506 stop:754 length:249 start_codon:yes stop_codon:yes gene_type:complete